MQANPSPRAERGNDNEREDEGVQRVVLDLILSEYPIYLTIWGVSRELSVAQDFAAEDAVERAVRGLVGVGLLDCHNGLLLPTRAALTFYGLELP